MAAASIITSVITGGSNSHQTVAQELNSINTDFVTQGVVGTITSGSPMTGAFGVTQDASPDMGITILSGRAYVSGTPSGQDSQVVSVRMTSNYTAYTINANASGSTRYDWIYLSFSAANANNPSAAADNVVTLLTSRSTSNSSDNGTPPTYGILLAVVTVANGASSITNANIADRRTVASLTTSGTASGTGWLATGTNLSTVTYNGNRSYTCVFNSVDLTATISNGMRLRFTRTVAAPTYMGGLLNGSTQYFTKTTPTGTLSTVTDNWTIMAHVNPVAYANGAIAGRNDSTIANGFYVDMLGTGQVRAVVYNGGAANFRTVQTYQSLPLNKKTHVAVTWASGTVLIYLDGVSVPVTAATLSGTNPTTAGTGGDFSIGRPGAFNGSYFNGYISGVGVFNAVLNVATIQSYISQVLAGSETNCIGAWSLNNVLTDQNAAGNNLSAVASAGFTSGQSPYAQGLGSQEYGIVTSASFSTNTTLTVQVPEGSAIPTSGGVSAVSYSTQKVPYGFPAQKDKWRVAYILNVTTTTTSNASYGAFANGSFKMTVPIGTWDFGWEANLYNQTTTAVGLGLSATALTGLTTSQAALITRYVTVFVSPAAATYENYVRMVAPLSVSSATDYIMYGFGATTSAGISAQDSTCEMFADNAYL